MEVRIVDQLWRGIGSLLGRVRSQLSKVDILAGRLIACLANLRACQLDLTAMSPTQPDLMDDGPELNVNSAKLVAVLSGLIACPAELMPTYADLMAPTAELTDSPTELLYLVMDLTGRLCEFGLLLQGQWPAWRSCQLSHQNCDVRALGWSIAGLTFGLSVHG